MHKYILLAALTALANAHVFPVPFVPASGDTRIFFTGLSGTATIYIYSAKGGMVQVLHETDGDGQLAWDVKSSDGNDVASGVYLYSIQSASDEKTGKLIIIR